MYLNSSERSNNSFFPGFLIGIFLIAAVCYIWHDSYIDDAYIGFRCIDNFFRDEGFNFNPFERVESVTNIGWLFFLAPFSAVIKPHIAGKVLGIIFLVFSAIIVSKIGVKYDRERNDGQNDLYVRYVLPLLVFTCPSFLYYSQSGMETSFLFTILGLPSFWQKSKHFLVYTALVYGFAFSVRPECILLFPLYAAALLLVGHYNRVAEELDKKEVYRAVFIWSAIIIIISLWRYTYFGDILPNTFYSKKTAFLDIVLRAGLFLSGKLSNLPMPYSGLFLIPIIFLGCNQLYRNSPDIFPVYFSTAITGWFFSVYAAEDWTSTPRYLAPYLPYCILIILAGLTHSQLLKIPRLKLPLRVFYSAFFLLLLFSNLVDGLMHFSSAATNVYPGYVVNCRNLLTPALEINAMLPQNAVIATRRIGLLGYITGREIFDYKFSLPHKDVISALKKAKLQYFDEPDNENLAEIWQKRRPDYILEDTKTIKAIIERQGANFQSFKLHGITYYHKKSFKIGETECWMLYASAT